MHLRNIQYLVQVLVLSFPTQLEVPITLGVHNQGGKLGVTVLLM